MSKGDAPRLLRVGGGRAIYDNRWVRLAPVDINPSSLEHLEHRVVRRPLRVTAPAIIKDGDEVRMM